MKNEFNVWDNLKPDVVEKIGIMNNLPTANPDYVFLPDSEIEKLVKGKKEDVENPMAVVKFFNPCGVGTWYCTSIDEYGVMFGGCELGGRMELGSVSLVELMEAQLPLGLKIERDMYFEPRKVLDIVVEYNKEV